VIQLRDGKGSMNDDFTEVQPVLWTGGAVWLAN